MIITIDGPTASGKSTIAYLLAEQFSALYINSGLLFRAVAYISEPLSEHLACLLNDGTLKYVYAAGSGAEIFYKDTNITPLLKTPEIDSAASIAALNPSIRHILLDYQRKLAHNGDVIADGRDCGTIVFPHADYKFYITANLEVRAQRWQKSQLSQAHKDNTLPIEQIKEIIAQRDTRDSQRKIAPLKPADDAFIIDTSHMTIQEVLTAIVEIIEES